MPMLMRCQWLAEESGLGKSLCIGFELQKLASGLEDQCLKFADPKLEGDRLYSHQIMLQKCH